MKQKQPIIFEGSEQDDLVEGEQTMDLLLHYAQNGVSEAEQVMREEPGLYSEKEILDFAANKVVLAKAPDILQDYKNKVREFEYMNEKLQSVLGKCEKIVQNYETRKLHDEDNYVDPHKNTAKPASDEIKQPVTIRYTDDGQIMMKSAAPRKQPRKKINIELPRR